MLLTEFLNNLWGGVQWVVENLWTILTIFAIVYGMIATYKSNKKTFWKKVEDATKGLITSAEQQFKGGEGSIKKKWVLDKLVEQFSSRFSFLDKFISKAKFDKVIEENVSKFNEYVNGNKSNNIPK